MNDKYTSTRIWSDTLRKLRQISALKGETMIEILARLVTEEHRKVVAETVANEEWVKEQLGEN